MPYFQEGDILGLLEEAGEEVAFSGVTTSGCIDIAESSTLSGELVHLVGKVIAVWVKTDALPGVTNGSLLSFRGKTFKVRERAQEGDGALTRLLCLEA